MRAMPGGPEKQGRARGILDTGCSRLAGWYTILTFRPSLSDGEETILNVLLGATVTVDT